MTPGREKNTMVSKLLSRIVAILRERQHSIPQYAVALLIPILGAALSFLSSDCSPSAVRWRASLKKSRFSPSAIKTAIIWIVLYVAMGHASYLVYLRLDTPSVLSAPLISYLSQCLLNHFYIIVLFGLQRIDLALLMMLPLWLTTGITALLFYEVCSLAGMLMSAVFFWVTVNVYFNIYLFTYNRVYTDADLSAGGTPMSPKSKAS